MAYNLEIAQRVARITDKIENITVKKMFGGVAYLLNGNMLCGVHKDYLILRLGEIAAKSALEKEGIRVFDITGRAMRGWVMADEHIFPNDDTLENWIKLAEAFVAELPAK